MRNIQGYSVSRGYQPYPHPNSINRYPQVSKYFVCWFFPHNLNSLFIQRARTYLTHLCQLFLILNSINRIFFKWAPPLIQRCLNLSQCRIVQIWVPSVCGKIQWVSKMQKVSCIKIFDFLNFVYERQNEWKFISQRKKFTFFSQLGFSFIIHDGKSQNYDPSA